MDKRIKKWLIKSHPEMKNAFKNKLDVYAFLASKIFMVDYKECGAYDLNNSVDGYVKPYVCTRLGQLYRRAAKMYALNAVCPTIDGMRDLRDMLSEIEHIRDKEMR